MSKITVFSGVNGCVYEISKLYEETGWIKSVYFLFLSMTLGDLLPKDRIINDTNGNSNDSPHYI